ncbi:fungal-specific transcription factor domain-containing protein [Fusarium redolens]|uniref:Fungal-specific transcription factor domain-containing protein n=1 Tax=Fusarium redolens TaxID=48865 RepID=A0A9P9JXC5_FUSRE|nr:fungal-specific transcription factor domain-containing protein [Fusarium redolens]KAH7232274.1 fungal-specific transcription factor domain-containing protein [Fusarium redolens]
MVVVAVAGGAGGIGGAIVDTLRPNPHHKMIILTRKIPDTPRGSDTFITLDYSDVDSMAKALDDNKVHTVISALRVFDPASSEAETNLVKATAQANTPKRFVASAWGIEYADTTLVGQARGRTLVELRATDLEWTRFDNGFFIDYYGPTSLKSYMKRVAWAIDIFVVAALDLPKWEELMYCYGEKTTWNKVLKQAEEATGCEFDVSYDPPEKLEKGEVAKLPSKEDAADLPQKVLEGLMSLWGLYVLEGKYDMLTEKSLNKVFPDIQPLKVLSIGGPLPDAATEADLAPAGTTARCSGTSNSEHHENLIWAFDGIPAVDAFRELDVDFTMLYMDQVFPFLFPFYAPPMIQGGRAWVLDILRHNKTMFHAVMSLSTFFFTLNLSSEDVYDYQTEVLAMNQLAYTTLLQRSRAMESITQPMVLEMVMAKTNESSMHLAAATSLFEDILEASKAPLTSQRSVWNTEQAALHFFFAILLWADIVSSTSLQTAPRLRKYYPNLICHDYGGVTTEPLLRMEEYVGCEGWALIAIAETAALDVWKREEQINGTLIGEALAKRGAQIDRVLQDGLRGLEERCRNRERQPRRILQGFYRSSDANQAAKQAAATRIWAHAARIYLAVVMRGWQSDHRESAGEVLRLLQQHDDPAILRSSVWPFCVAGCVADANQEKGFRDLVAASGSLQSFGRVGESLGILERVWSRRGELSVEWILTACFSIMGAPVLLL